MITVYVLGGLIGAWFLFCGGLWIHYIVSGHKHDHSGDGALAVFFLPLLPFLWLWWKLVEGVTWVGTKIGRLLDKLGF